MKRTRDRARPHKGTHEEVHEKAHDGTPEDPSGPWSDEEIESTSRDSLMEENVDLDPADENLDVEANPGVIEVDPANAPDDPNVASEDSADKRIPE